ncbi:MAG TPA: hypothetical protein PLS49_04840 [Candidatus Woesebacteria bacterium]|nr:hypothetical protein [Candidatus Woesebacteria bacterium]
MTCAQKKTQLDQQKEKTFKIYKSWKKVYCPALQTHVHFTLLGWKHVLNKKYRSGAEKLRRLDILPLARPAIAQAKNYKNKRKQIGYTTYELIEEVKDIKVSIIIIERQKAFKFLSIFRA